MLSLQTACFWLSEPLDDLQHHTPAKIHSQDILQRLCVWDGSNQRLQVQAQSRTHLSKALLQVHDVVMGQGTHAPLEAGMVRDDIEDGRVT